jgi:hypothetical protein
MDAFVLLNAERCTLVLMWIRRLRIERVTPAEEAIPCPLSWIDNFAMRNFTNDAIFDDTLPAGDGILEAGLRVPLDRLQTGHGGLVPAQGLSETRGETARSGNRAVSRLHSACSPRAYRR